jgi:transcriptional regulator with XRE-family HTH domain
MSVTAANLVLAVDPATRPAAKRLASAIGTAKVVSAEEGFPERRRSRPACVLYLKGTESLNNVKTSLEKVAGTDQDVVFYIAGHTDTKIVFQWGLLCERLLPGRSRGIVSSEEDLRSILENNPASLASQIAERDLTVETLRRSLGLTQAQMAKAAEVTTRTIQNWERDRQSISVSRAIKDLAELYEILLDHVLEDKIAEWLNSENENLGNRKPIQLLQEGQTRDLLWQLRSVATGEPA